MKVSQFTNSKGNKVANQFIIFDSERTQFQSYDSIIVETGFENNIRYTKLDSRYWDYSRTTSKYRNQFLGETTKKTQAKIDSGEYELTNLNE